MNITRFLQLRKLRFIAAAVIVAVATLVIPLTQIASARSADPIGASDNAKPTIVLVHGAWADSGSWERVTKRLQAHGYTVYALPNPLRGLYDDSAYLADFLHTISGPIVLVGHSYGGAVITNAATGDPQVKALVYVDAFAPAQGQTLAQLLASHPGSCAVPANLTIVPFRGAPSGVGDAYIKQSVFRSCMANDLPAREAGALGVVQRPIATIALGQPSGVPAWLTIPSWAVVGTADHAIPPALQLAMANAAGAHISTVNASHLSMVSHPAVVADVILHAARATS
ncbi:MAG TPA: alpha/beta hydrolase [Jatrophihabitans sp.]|jgi:pimeloyl-ACP methyl ester carboxylesterase